MFRITFHAVFHTAVGLAALSAMTASPALADFTYHEKTTVTGGALAGMLKVAAVFSKQAREPQESTVSVKGDRMLHRSATHISIIDLRAETITSVDMQKKNYTVMTFEQMKQMMQQMQDKMQQQKTSKPDNTNSADISFKVSANATGATKPINGVDTKEMVITLEMQGTDQQSGQTGTMTIKLDQWIGPEMEGYREVREFYKRMTEKIAWSGSGNMFASRPDVMKGLAEAQKQTAKMEGIPLVSVMVMMGPPNPDGSQPQDAAPAPRPSLGGLIGAGIGVKRSNKDSAAQPSSSSGTPGSLLETTTEMTGFSREPVDEGQFAVPPGFKKVEVRGMQ
jgi:hypothetical protein